MLLNSFSFFLPPAICFCPKRYFHLFLHSSLAVLSPFLHQPPSQLFFLISSPISGLFCANSVIFPHLFFSLFCQLLFLTCFCTLSPPSPLRYSLQLHRPLDEAPFHLKEDKKGETSMILFENHLEIFNFRIFLIKLKSLYDFTWCSILTPRMVTTPVVVGQSRTFENHIYHQGLGSGWNLLFFYNGKIPNF